MTRDAVLSRLALFVAELHLRSRHYGWFLIRQSEDICLVNLNGLVVAPRPNTTGGLPWPNTAGKGRRTAVCGTSHARFDGWTRETERADGPRTAGLRNPRHR